MRVFTVMDYISNRTRLKAMSIIFRMKSIYYCVAVPYFLARPNLVFSQFEIAACLQSTAKNDEISPHFLLGKFWGNGLNSHNFPKGKWKFPFPFNFP